jgi:hypothetical protein
MNNTSGKFEVLKIDDLSTLYNLEIQENQTFIVQFQSKIDVINPINLQIVQNKNSSFKLICAFKHSINLNLDIKILGDNTVLDIYNLVYLNNDKKVFLNQNISTSFTNNQVEHITKCILDQTSYASIKHIAKAKVTTKNLKLNQKIQTLILSPQAKTAMQPILQIESEDVNCKHGATQGFLDSNSLFYLQSRGLDLQTAKDLLIDVFKDEVIRLID